MGEQQPQPPTMGPPSQPRSTMPMLYYGLVVVGTAAVVLALYNLIIVRWCAQVANPRHRPRRPSHSYVLSSVSSFKYKREGAGDGPECVVCLSAFEEGEELRRLPKCNHSFHAPCIDMWLYTHMDCPLCRSQVEPEHPRQGLLPRPTV
ncbi:RING-H2 finger protein ATL52 [Striga hermonthica]|uniref:RING-H2 finger protein ATL52 n=1 Tax=Striga hermonthica TaxID=68872 RepID=A0A9N7N693_STRHE|nr:RING-H2 finger protein ATL52 [Striga hermonthica]